MRSASGAMARGDRPAAEVARELVTRTFDAHPLARVGAAWVAACGDWPEGASAVHAAVVDALEHARPGAASRSVGVEAVGLLARDGEWRREPAVGLLAVEDAGIEPFAVEHLAGEEDRAGPELVERLGGPAREGDALVVWPDGDALAAGPLAESLGAALAGARVFGAGVAPARPGEPAGWLAGRPVPRGLVGWRIRPDGLRVAGRASLGFQLRTGRLAVTRARGHWVLGLGGRPALDVFREAAGPALAADARRAARVLKLAVLEPGVDPHSPGAVVALRNAVGLDPRRRAFSIAEPVETGREVVLVQLDPEAARRTLEQGLASPDDRGSPPDPERRFAIHLSCHGRGEALFGWEGLEAGTVDRALAGAPWLGIFGAYQLAPGLSPGRLERLAYSSLTIDVTAD